MKNTVSASASHGANSDLFQKKCEVSKPYKNKSLEGDSSVLTGVKFSIDRRDNNQWAKAEASGNAVIPYAKSSFEGSSKRKEIERLEPFLAARNDPRPRIKGKLPGASPDRLNAVKASSSQAANPLSTHARIEQALRKDGAHEVLVKIGLEQLGAKETLKKAELPADFYAALGGKSPENMAAVGTSMLLLHESCLIVDDIQDNDTMRRGQPTTWVRHGLSQALNTAMFMFARAMGEMAAAVPGDPAMGQALVASYTDGIAKMIEGQAMDEVLSKNPDATIDDYFTAARLKNGTSIALSAELPAMLLGHSREEARKIAEVFKDLGILHQIVNDLDDVLGCKGRAPGQDLYEGKKSVIALAYQQQVPADAKRFVQFLARPRDTKSAEEVGHELERIQASGTIDRVMGLAREKAAEILQVGDQLAGLPDVQNILQKLIGKFMNKVEQFHGELEKVKASAT
jgi:geranylgeranyl pyrophosphate synthase